MKMNTPAIDCRTVRERLWEYLDGEVEPGTAAVIRAHLEQCGHCAPVAELSKMFLGELGALRQDDVVPAPIRARILVALGAQRGTL